MRSPSEEFYGLSICFSEMNERFFFVESPIERVAGLYYSRKRMGLSHWECDVYGQLFQRPGTIFYQLRGHKWTGTEKLGYNPEAFSLRLECKVLVYGQIAGDDFPLVYYQLYDHGEIIEKFAYQNGPDAVFQFSSKVRDVRRRRDEEPFRFIDSTFKGLGLYAVGPPLESTGKRNEDGFPIFTLTHAFLSRKDFERVDLVIP